MLKKPKPFSDDQASPDSAKRGQQRNVYAHCIEGRYITTRELATLLGVDTSTVRVRLKKLRAQPGAITFEALSRP